MPDSEDVMQEVPQGVVPKEPQSKYHRHELITNAQAVFGVMPEVVIGALHNNKAEELTVSEVKAAVEEFLKRKVK